MESISHDLNLIQALLIYVSEKATHIALESDPDIM